MPFKRRAKFQNALHSRPMNHASLDHSIEQRISPDIRSLRRENVLNAFQRDRPLFAAGFNRRSAV